jgi:hypothetical protein
VCYKSPEIKQIRDRRFIHVRVQNYVLEASEFFTGFYIHLLKMQMKYHLPPQKEKTCDKKGKRLSPSIGFPGPSKWIS